MMMNKQTGLSTIEEGIEEIKAGKVIIVVDDEDRENEGDFIVAAEKVTPEIVNFMITQGRGVLCAPLTQERCRELELEPMTQRNTSLLGTPFTVTADLLGHDCTTGVSAHDRAATIRALSDPAFQADDFGRPGHICPLYANERGVLGRDGHTEAAIDLARLAGLRHERRRDHGTSAPAAGDCRTLRSESHLDCRPDCLPSAQQLLNIKPGDTCVQTGRRVPRSQPYPDVSRLLSRTKTAGKTEKAPHFSQHLKNKL